MSELSRVAAEITEIVRVHEARLNSLDSVEVSLGEMILDYPSHLKLHIDRIHELAAD